MKYIQDNFNFNFYYFLFKFLFLCSVLFCSVFWYIYIVRTYCRVGTVPVPYVDVRFIVPVALANIQYKLGPLPL
jgi:hypothetical protein